MNSRDTFRITFIPDLTQASHVPQIYCRKFTECYSQSVQWYARSRSRFCFCSKRVLFPHPERHGAIAAGGTNRFFPFPFLVSRSNALMKSETNFTVVRPVIVNIVARNLTCVDSHYVARTHERPHAGFETRFDGCSSFAIVFETFMSRY